jgi:hypothetical protein
MITKAYQSRPIESYSARAFPKLKAVGSNPISRSISYFARSARFSFIPRRRNLILVTMIAPSAQRQDVNPLVIVLVIDPPKTEYPLPLLYYNPSTAIIFSKKLPAPKPQLTEFKRVSSSCSSSSSSSKKSGQHRIGDRPKESEFIFSCDFVNFRG